MLDFPAFTAVIHRKQPALTTTTIYIVSFIKVNLESLCFFRSKGNARCSAWSTLHQHNIGPPSIHWRCEIDASSIIAEQTWHKNRRFDDRLWIRLCISTGSVVRKPELVHCDNFYTPLFRTPYSDYAAFIFSAIAWFCSNFGTYPQKLPRLLLLLFLYKSFVKQDKEQFVYPQKNRQASKIRRDRSSMETGTVLDKRHRARRTPFAKQP